MSTFSTVQTLAGLWIFPSAKQKDLPLNTIFSFGCVVLGDPSMSTWNLNTVIQRNHTLYPNKSLGLEATAQRTTGPSPKWNFPVPMVVLWITQITACLLGWRDYYTSGSFLRLLKILDFKLFLSVQNRWQLGISREKIGKHNFSTSCRHSVDKVITMKRYNNI